MGVRRFNSECSVEGTILLGDLRWLVRETELLDDGARIIVQEEKRHSPTDTDPAKITIRGEARVLPPPPADYDG